MKTCLYYKSKSLKSLYFEYSFFNRENRYFRNPKQIFNTIKIKKYSTYNNETIQANAFIKFSKCIWYKQSHRVSNNFHLFSSPRQKPSTTRTKLPTLFASLFLSVCRTPAAKIFPGANTRGLTLKRLPSPLTTRTVMITLPLRGRLPNWYMRKSQKK